VLFEDVFLLRVVDFGGSGKKWILFFIGFDYCSLQPKIYLSRRKCGASSNVTTILFPVF
jgi:hypothetical protein